MPQTKSNIIVLSKENFTFIIKKQQVLVLGMDWAHWRKAGAKMLSQVNKPKKLLRTPPPGPPPVDSNASGTSVELLRSLGSEWKAPRFYRNGGVGEVVRELHEMP